MKKSCTFLRKITPRVSKKNLMLIAGIVWSVPSFILLTKGFKLLLHFPSIFIFGIIFSLTFGALFYFLLFNKISSKYINRIKSLEKEYPCAFSFFNWKGYIMMATMILLGITLRSTEIIPTQYLSILYFTMGIPLTISALRFFMNWAKQ